MDPMGRMQRKRWFHLGFVGWLTKTGLTLAFIAGRSNHKH